MADYGQSAAFNFRTNQGQNAANQIADMQYADQLKRQNEAMAMAKAKMFADDLEFQQGSNPYYSAVIQKQNQDMLVQLGEFRRNNKDLLFNPEKMAQLKAMKHSYKSTPAVLGSAAYMDAVKQYNEFSKLAQKNPSAYNLDQLEAFKQKLSEYNNMSPDQPLPPPLMFNAPDELPDFDKLHREYGNSTDPDVFEKVNNGRVGAYKGYVSDKRLTDLATTLYNEHKAAYDYKFKNSPDKIAAIKSTLLPLTKTIYNNGEKNTLGEQMYLAKFKNDLEKANATGKSAYELSFLNTDMNDYGDEILAGTFTRKAPNYYVDANGNQVLNKDADFFFDGDAQEESYGQKGAQRTGVKVMGGKFYKPLDWGVQSGVLSDPFGLSGDYEGTDLEVKPELRDYYKIVPNPNGKGDLILEVKSTAKVNGNTALYKQRFDAIISKMTGKQRNATSVDPILEQDAPSKVVQGGYEYVYNPSTGQYE